ncbi:MAG: transglutaminase-like cysteine peptidase [Sneathiella sp.]
MIRHFLTSSTFLSLILGASISAASPENQVAGRQGMFDTIEISSTNLAALPQWLRVMGSFGKTAKAASLCDSDIQKCKSQQMTLWRAKIQELELSGTLTKIREINRFINKWRTSPDLDTYKKKDHWATPLEFITNGGDSEDFAIMKYISLKELGISPKKMRIVVTNDVLRGVTHAFLSVQANAKRFVLDSQNDTVLQEDLVTYYIPFYSVNETTRWAHVPKQTASSETAAGIEKND